MGHDEALRSVCCALLESRAGSAAESKWLHALIAELVERKLLHPNAPVDEQHTLARAFAAALLAE